MDEDMAGIVAILVVVTTFFGGYWIGKYSVKEDCDAFGMYKAKNEIYECKVKQ